LKVLDFKKVRQQVRSTPPPPPNRRLSSKWAGSAAGALPGRSGTAVCCLAARSLAFITLL
jgi:hypothetical protein